ncbi:MAG: chromosome segregation protein SMC [Candidatus Nitronauta litoralis]|uniref:Chromosome partition protein Smc n=1 Tax=Candidatus Nitronauta litoralis TaxID=2705533 RepID=A0A7T0BVC9_9BACT|nr:MAG: chromosome segregation protein SMC [Candidatus Nitronauta litoralis]
MILKNLELAGFKSFVDGTHLDFTQGFTAVVGPNGCGKSNISDAIRWVIGEQSSKQLRGTRVADLIFNGTAHRKPVNRAEVTMTLSDVPEGLRIATIPNASEEIKVTRCYHRSGESEFYINNVPCRLKDITDLFLDVGISPKVLTVIEQNHVQDIVTSKPEDRRIWIEEAAGVLKFKVRKNEALRKLDTAGQNLDRISDIVQELERQVESLKRQASKAERYKQFHIEMKDLSLRLFSQKIRRFQKELEEIGVEVEQKTETKTVKQARLSELETRIEQLKFDIDTLVGELNAKKETRHELSEAIGKNEHRIELKKQQIEQARTDIESGKREITEMLTEIEVHEQETIAQRNELTAIGEQINERETQLESRTQEQSAQKEKLQVTEVQLKEVEKKVLDLWHRTSQKKNEVTALVTRQENLESREASLEKEESDTRLLNEDAISQEGEARISNQSKEAAFDQLKQQHEAAQQRLVEEKEIAKEKRNQAMQSKEAYMGKQSLFTSLTELRKKFEGFGEGVQSLMGNGNGDRMQGLREVLGNVLKAPAEYESAVEAVLGNRLNSVIVDSYNDSAEAIRYLSENKSGRGTFIPMNPKSAPKPPVYLNGHSGVIGKARDFVQTTDDYSGVIDHLLGDVVIVRDFDTALHLYGQEQFQGTVVTLEGEVIDSLGIVSGGVTEETGEGPLARNREMELLSKEVEVLQAEMLQAEEEVVGQDERMAQAESAVESLTIETQQARIELAHSQKDLESFQQENVRLQKKLETLAFERKSAAQEREELTARHTELLRELEQEESDKQQYETRVAELKTESEQHRQKLEEINSSIHEVQVWVTSLTGKRETVLNEIKRLQQQQENLKHRIRQREGEQGLNRDKIEDCEKIIAEAEETILTQARDKDTLSEDIVQGEDELHGQEESLAAQEKETRTLHQEVQELSESIFKIESKRSEIQLQTTHLEEKAFEDFSVNREELMHGTFEEVDENPASKRIAELKEKIRKLGDVNLAALSDFQVANERYLFLHEQEQDLTRSIQTLHETIEKIDETTRQLFLDTFNKVNEHFKHLFSRLFQGGKAELSLDNPDNPLESGVDITASPAGKSMHNITLLSGGEKTMTAIALIFALLKVRPSPFCLLDEIDAPLDEANVVRFQEMLQEFSGDTQFIIITHNQKTMGFADTLYGVTMEEHGVSKVVSVHLNN